MVVNDFSLRSVELSQDETESGNVVFIIRSVCLDPDDLVVGWHSVGFPFSAEVKVLPFDF